ncbi:MAG: hypothetical protein F4Y24_17640 [Gemmatimonadetes bacterium]|nr:hypothetical protein [Gemmatimonadota bacterium]MYG23779.1 hypothetical protein [Gemmatimonadota bacterium]MYJ40318.1 hypothetical protein [Gemmatimonadota bacterium]
MAVNVTVTARDPGGSSARQSFGVWVVPFLLSITVSPTSDTIAPSDVDGLSAAATGPDGDRVDGVDFEWTSSDPNVVRILLPPSFHLRSDTVQILGEAEGTATITATARGASGSSTIAVVNPDRVALTALYDATDGPGWRSKTNWLSDEPMATWHGVVGNVYDRVIELRLQDNDLSGEIPPELGQLSFLRELVLNENGGLSGELPSSIAELQALQVFLVNGTGLCLPPEPRLLSWLDGLNRVRIPRCSPETVLAHLSQAVQSRAFPVPLVAGDRAVLRVFPIASRATDASIPPVRASFHLPGGATHVVEIPGSDAPIPTAAAVSEESLTSSANTEIDGSLVQPGLEMVIEVDPEGTLEPGLLVTRRIPESGRVALDVRTMPTFQLTLIPFLLEAAPDSSVLRITRAMSDNPLNHTLLGKTRTLLPVGDIEVLLHDPVVTSNHNAESLLRETDLIRVMEGAAGYYLGTMTGPVVGNHGLAYQSGRSSFSVVDLRERSELVIAHELGHNMSLQHPSGCGAGFVDASFPHSGGTIGAWGYDFRYGGRLVAPDAGDLMSYCQYDWISDYHFTNALRHRLADEKTDLAATVSAPVKSLLLWGSVSSRGTVYLEPAFLVHAPAALPGRGGAYAIAGHRASGEEVFSLRFDMLEEADGDGSGSFAFTLPVEEEWDGSIAGISLSGPGGTALLTRDTDRPVTILRDATTGRIRGILRGESAGFADPDMASGSSEQPRLEAHFSRGLPDTGAWHPR